MVASALVGVAEDERWETTNKLRRGVLVVIPSMANAAKPTNGAEAAAFDASDLQLVGDPAHDSSSFHRTPLRAG